MSNTHPDYAGLYNNGAGYGLGAIVLTDGNPYGIAGAYFIRSGNPGNPGYPPEPGGAPNGSWTLYTLPKGIDGAGSITGLGNIMGQASGGGGGGFAYTYTMDTSLNIFVFDSVTSDFDSQFYFYNDPEPSELTTLSVGKQITISGVPAPYAALNGTSFVVDYVLPYPGYSEVRADPGSTFRAAWFNLGLSDYTTIPGSVGTITWNWN